MTKNSHPVVTTDKQIDAAIARAGALQSTEQRATRATYDPKHDRITIELSNRVVVSIPRQQLQGLTGVGANDIAQIELVGNGTGLHWPTLDVDHYIPGLLNQVFGTRAWMAHLGRRGGASTSTAKKRAARANGRKGGRPSKRRRTA
jgi:hypothetical protein